MTTFALEWHSPLARMWSGIVAARGVLQRRFEAWRAPAVALAVFAALISLSSLRDRGQ